MDLIEASSTTQGRHPWEMSRTSFFLDLLKRQGILTPSSQILDVGAGDGYFSKAAVTLAGPHAKVVCWDSGYSDMPLNDAQFKSNPQATFSATRPDQKFDLLLLMDVLEHVEHDRLFLRDLVAENLKSGGHVLISVPAWLSLFSDHDRRLKHFRRYSPSACREVIQASGLEVQSQGGLFHSLLLPRILQKVKESAITSRAIEHAETVRWTAPSAVTFAVMTVLKIDNWFSTLASRAGLNVPGLSWWSICRKNST